MAIYLHTGTPGGGKTYLAVDNILNRYYKYDKKKKEYVKSKDVAIITNIDELKLDHLKLDDEIDLCLKDHIDSEFDGDPVARSLQADLLEEKISEMKKEFQPYFFNYEYQEKLYNKYGHILYVIDECQIYFDSRISRNKWARKVFLFFEKHRHLGFDIYLITQSKNKIASDIRCLVERETRALPRSLSLAGEMKYNEYVSGVKTNALPKVKPFSKRVASMYKSMEVEEVEKVKSPLLKIAAIGVVALMLGSFVLYKKFFGREEYLEATGKIESKEMVKNGKNQVVRDGKVIQMQPSKKAEEWVQISYVIVGKDIRVYDPFSDSIVPFDLIKSDYKWKWRRVGNTLQAKLKGDDLERYKTVKDANRPERESGGGSRSGSIGSDTDVMSYEPT